MSIASLQTLESLDGPVLAPYRTMRMQFEHYAERIFVAEGEKVVRRLLESEIEVLSVLLPERWLEPMRPLIERRAEAVAVFVADKKLLEGLTGYSMYQGLLAVARIPAPLPIEVAVQRSVRPRLLAAVDGLANAENLGALVRSCVAFRVQALVVGETSSSPYLRRAVRASMGTVFQLPVVETSDLAGLLGRLRASGVRCVAAHPHAEGRTVAEASMAGDCCVVLGSEGPGLSEAVREACDECVAIPMASAVDSLNVGSAGAVFLYEANRQRGWISRM
ncbi:MAG TPA: RNA methyltransferase [Verrucomicrobiota bacterium]|nr:RNA methyltransferase [Verrucomicrobiota bacterium]HNU51240.1 RNA methyltransferase [Verrucomicrobiota bacterium]